MSRQLSHVLNFMGHRSNPITENKLPQIRKYIKSKNHVCYPAHRLANGDIYQGPVINHVITGYGMYIFVDGGVFEGDFLGGQMHGSGWYFAANKDTFEGEFMEGFRHGFGIYTYADGTKYECNWRRGVREGRCKLTFTNGAVFLGDFQAGELQSVGHYIFSSGVTYTGDFKRGEFSGYGEYDYVDGSHCCGHFEHGYCKSATTGCFCRAPKCAPRSIAPYLNIKDSSVCQPGSCHHTVQESRPSKPITLASKLLTLLQMKKNFCLLDI